MTPTKVLLGQIAAVFAIIIGSQWAATQWAAAMLGHQAALGSPWFTAAGQPVYLPWRLYSWWYAYEAYAPAVFNKAGALAAAGAIVGVAVAVIGSVWRARQTSNVTTFGSSRWATRADAEKAGLFGSRGVFLGRLGNRYLRHQGPEHVMAFAPTRSGKGVGLVVPTLLSWTGSAVVHDIKGENWQLTSGWRSRFSHCLLFDPTDHRSAKYNPLMEVRRGPAEVRDVQNVADILVDPEGSLERRNHWEKTSHALLVGVILHVLYAEKEKTLARVASFLSDPSRSFERTLRVMMTTNHQGTEDKPQVHPVVAEAARELLNKSDNERSGVLSTAMSFLGLYRDPTVAHVTSACDWRIADLLDAPNPVSLYLVIPPSDISRTKPLVRLILNQIGRRLTEGLVSPHPKRCTRRQFPYLNRLVAASRRKKRRQLLMMLDEFPALGRLDFFESALAWMAGYGIRAYLIAQSLNQISKAYGENHSILDNCHVRIAFASNDERTARRISDSLGTATELRAQKNYAGHRLAPWLAHVMVSRQETARPLLTPGEVMQLPEDDQLVLVSGRPPIKAKKLKYFKDPNFIDRVVEPSPLCDVGYADKPEPRPDDWSGVVRGTDARLEPTDDPLIDDLFSDDGGLKRHPELATDQPARRPEPPRHEPSLLDDDFDESCPTLDKHGHARTLGALQRAHAVNRGDDADLLPKF